MKKLTDKLLEFDIIHLGIKDWRFLHEVDSSRERKKKEKEITHIQNKIPQCAITLCPNYSFKNEKLLNTSKDNKQIKSEQENVKSIGSSSKASILNESSQNKPNPKREKNKLVTAMIKELYQNDFESAFLLFEDLLQIKPLEWGEFSYLWYYAIKRRNIESVDRLINLINTINTTLLKSEIKSIGDVDNFTEKEVKGKDYLNGEQDNNFDLHDRTISRILNVSQTNVNIFDNNDNLNTVNNNELYDLAAYPTPNKINGSNNVVNDSLFAPAGYNNGLMSSSNLQGNFGNMYPPQYTNSYPFNSQCNPLENFLQQIVFNNYMQMIGNQQPFDMNSLNYMSQPNNFLNNYNMLQNPNMNMLQNPNMNMLQNPNMNQLQNPNMNMNMNMNMFNPNIGVYNAPMNNDNFGALKNNLMNQNYSPQLISNNIQGVNYGINNANVYQQQQKQSHPDMSIKTPLFSNLNNEIENNFCVREENSYENKKYFVENDPEHDMEVDLFNNQYMDSEMPYSNQFIENVYESLLFSDDLEFAKSVGKIVNRDLKYSKSNFISNEAMNYYKEKRYSYFFEVIESVHQCVIKLRTDKLSENVSLVGKISKAGNRYAQDVIAFIPKEDNAQLKISKKSNILTKENYSKISEREFVLLTDERKKISVVALIKSIENDLMCKILVSPFYLDEEYSSSVWKITKLTNYTCFEKTIEALRKFSSTKLCSDNLLKIIFSQYEAPTKHNEISYNNYNNRSDRSRAKIDINRIAEIKLVDNPNFKVINKYLNESQKEALRKARSQVLTLIQGPPGTGKTTIGIEIILEWLRIDPESQVLVCADSNVAVDILYRELCKAGVKSFRFGSKNSRENLKVGHGHFIRQLKENSVICTTCVGSLSDYLNEMNFRRLLIDEATQATELATIIPMLKNVKQVVLIGDHKQLSPTVISMNALKEGLGVSLFERLVENGVEPVLLNTQYRMHPSISNFPSDYFYKSRVINGVDCNSRLPIMGFKWPNNDIRVAFIDINGVELVDGNSYYNQQEITKTVEILLDICKHKSVKLSDIGVITPYDAQKKKLQTGIKKALIQLDNFYDISLSLDSLNPTGDNSTGISVDTVDGFQGMDKDLIIFSSVRCNDKGNVGFLKDPRRLNVMLTRAKRGLIVIGNYKALMAEMNWREWIGWAEYYKVVIRN